MLKPVCNNVRVSFFIFLELMRIFVATFRFKKNKIKWLQQQPHLELKMHWKN